MPSRLRLYDCRVSDLPTGIGLCQADLPRVANAVNSAQRRLLLGKESGDEGWWGTWAEMAFTISRTSPYLTLPREVARIEAVNVCNRPLIPQNQFFEYLEFGNGRLPKCRPGCSPWGTQIMSRNLVPTFIDLSPAPQFIRVYATNPLDVDGTKRVLIQGLDNNRAALQSLDGQFTVQGEYLILDSPFAQLPLQMNQITGIQKDVTQGSLQFFQVDPATGNQVLLLTMEGGEQVASYRRYYFHHLPRNCCGSAPGSPNQVTITAICKLDLIPVVVDADYCLIQNLEALIEECQSKRYSTMDSTGAKQMSRERHEAAIGLLKGELAHYLGVDQPAVNFAPFGSARLSRLKVGMQ